MNYSEFKAKVMEELNTYLAEHCSEELEVCIEKIYKINAVLEGVVLRGRNTQVVSPVVYIDSMYDYYNESGDLEGVLKYITDCAAEYMEEAGSAMPQIPAVDFDALKENIVFQFINTELNTSLLSEAPHREFQDLSIIYRLMVAIDEDGIRSGIVKNPLAEKLGLSEEQLFSLAMKNTHRILPPVIKPIHEVIRDLLIADGLPSDIAEAMMAENSQEVMWVISNSRGINGAISVLYEDNLHRLAENLASDLYILPSSIHECIAVSVDIGDLQEFACMVKEVNITDVLPEDRLSGSVYYYDRKRREISLAMSNSIV